MAFGKGSNSSATSVVEYKKYIGIASLNVKAINPTKVELEKIYGRTLDKEPEYIGEKVIEGVGTVKTLKIDFIVATDPLNPINSGIEYTTRLSFYLLNEPRYNRDRSKLQVIDKYGRTAWVTLDQFQKHEIPVYSNGPAQLDKSYRGVYSGEEELTNFLKTYLMIPNVMTKDKETGELVIRDNAEDSECRLDNISNYFSGNILEIKNAIALEPDNAVKVLLGVQTSDDNKTYQTFYKKMFINNRQINYDYAMKMLSKDIAGGYMNNCKFLVTPLQVFSEAPTAFTQTQPTVAAPSEAPSIDNINPWDVK